MYFHKVHHPTNFAFASCRPAEQKLTVGGEKFPVKIKNLGADVFRLNVTSPRWPKNFSQASLAKSFKGQSKANLSLTNKNTLTVTDADGGILLRGRQDGCFGVSGKAWMFRFELQPDMQFYGMGEKYGPLEKSAVRTKFWNTDVWGDFAIDQVRKCNADPLYVSIPYLIVKQGNRYLGIFINNPDAVFMDTGAAYIWDDANDEKQRKEFFLGAPAGAAELYFIVGPSLAELTRKFQTLCGRTPLPPLWALGHHQCRWGYRGTEDLNYLDRQFTKHQIPCDGLWLDIDYMDAYKVFTLNPKHFKHAKKEIAALANKGRHIVPILDPGVKVEKGYAIQDDGLKENIFCQNPEGLPFVGYVWPGRTYFPDFSIAKARQWWAKHTKKFFELGFSGAWLDMNDPSVGAVEVEEMLFNHGKHSHATYHNQYALGMAEASRDGFLAAKPNQRPFFLCRSGCAGTGSFTALWTGDNFSNYSHMRGSIPQSLNLALSGVPFNGPDVGGFGDDGSADLTIKWYQQGFLFPFLRNHSVQGSRSQEPWAFGQDVLDVSRHYIALRYKLLPYLYNLFIRQDANGEAIMRPLFYDFADSAKLPLGKIDDQFMIGPDLMQAPLVEEGKATRKVVLPAATWFSAQSGQWLKGGKTISATCRPAETPLFIREGAIVPMQSGTRKTNDNDLSAVELHIFLHKNSKATGTYEYAFDDGISFDYQKGRRSSFTVSARVIKGALQVGIDHINNGYRPAKIKLVTYDNFKAVSVKIAGRSPLTPSTQPAVWIFTGKGLPTQNSGWINL